MVNPTLYNKLKSLFKHITIANENVKPKIKPSNIAGQWRFDDSVSGEAYILNCPFCQDHKHHLYISSISFTQPRIGETIYPQAPLLGKCFRRDCLKEPANREKLVQALAIGTALQIDVDQEESIWGSDSSVDLHSLDAIKEWCPDYHSFAEPDEVCQQYLKQRKVRDKDIAELQIGWGKCWDYRKGKYLDDNPRIILPIIQFNELKGIQYRAVYPEQFPRYYFDPRTPKSMLLYNYERACRFRICVMVEGVFDCLAVGANCMAYYGSKPSKAQCQLITQAGFDMLIWLPDTKISRDPNGKITLDPPAIARKQCDSWNLNNTFPWGAHVVLLPDKDASDCGMGLVWQTIIRQVAPKLNNEQLNVMKEEISKL